MLYTYRELQGLSFTEIQQPLSRYMHKFLNKRKEIRKLKFHEKDFLFQKMLIFRDDNNDYCFDLKEIKEASDFYFFRLILIYIDNLDFDRPTLDAYSRIISQENMAADKVIFDSFFSEWKTQIDNPKGKYHSHIHLELYRRLRELDEIGNYFPQSVINYQKKYLYAVSFYIYYRVALFFDGVKNKHLTVTFGDYTMVINIYSYVHILFRHYIPSLDITEKFTDRSLNDELPFLDMNNLPDSVKVIVELYCENKLHPIVSELETILFVYKDTKYIIWLKYAKLEELSGDYGFEFRTLYKCEKQRDLDKFNDKSCICVGVDLFFFVKR